MRQSRLITHIMRNPIMAMEPSALRAACSIVMSNLANGVSLEFPAKVLSRIAKVSSVETDGGSVRFCIDNSQSSDCSDPEDVANALSSNTDQFINLVYISGPMTVDGDACSYGSADHKAMMMQAADNPNCRGHILYINSEGGEAATLEDYREAINYCYSKGQNVAGVFKYAASAACFSINMGNRTYAEKPSSEIGSMGMLALFTTIADGTTIPQTNEVVHIRYADQSTDKNLMFREASEGNLKPIDKMLHDELAITLADTKADRPSITSDQLTGKMYKARDVMGSLVDQIGNVDDAADWLMADYAARNGAPIPLKESTADAMPHSQSTANPIHNNLNMKQYTAIANSLGIDPIEVIEGEDLSLNEELAQQLEQNVSSSSATIASLQEQVAALSAELASKDAVHQAAIDALNAEHASALAAKDAEHAAAIDALNAEHEAAIATVNSANEAAVAQLNADHAAAVEAINAEHATAIDQLNATHADAVKAANDSLASANSQLLAAQQRITDLNAEVEALNNAQGAAIHAGAQPSGNGQQASEPMRIVTSSTYDPSLSSAENARRRRNGNN